MKTTAIPVYQDLSQHHTVISTIHNSLVFNPHDRGAWAAQSIKCLPSAQILKLKKKNHPEKLARRTPLFGLLSTDEETDSGPGQHLMKITQPGNGRAGLELSSDSTAYALNHTLAFYPFQ